IVQRFARMLEGGSRHGGCSGEAALDRLAPRLGGTEGRLHRAIRGRRGGAVFRGGSAHVGGNNESSGAKRARNFKSTLSLSIGVVSSYFFRGFCVPRVKSV